MRRLVLLLSSWIVVLAVALPVWGGNISGTVKVKGEWKVTRKKKLDLTMRARQSLRVNKANQGLSNTVVYIKQAEGTFSLPSEPAVLDQVAKTFVPHILPVLAGTKMMITTQDNFRHTIATRDELGCLDKTYYGQKIEPVGDQTVDQVKKANKIYIQTWAKGEKEIIDIFGKPCKVRFYCDEHIRMDAWLVILSNPYFALTDKEGKYQIQSVPPGDYELGVWHEVLGEQATKITVTEGDTEANFELEGKTI
jgi:hypothetical protein